MPDAMAAKFYRDALQQARKIEALFNRKTKAMNYCTIFDTAYTSRGLLCHKSLLNVEPDAHLYIFCLDIECATLLLAENLVNCTVLHPKEFECTELLAVKSKRSNGEYAWTVKPYAISYIFSKFNADECSYIDADLYFYAAPKILSGRFNKSSVILTPHNYSRTHDTSEMNGIYCAQFVKFRNDKAGNDLLMWWKERCLEWCYNRHEPGRFGDQKYLEQIALKRSVAAANSFCFAAPWNITRYRLKFQKSVLFAIDKETNEMNLVIFFHFHGLKLINRFSFDVGGYYIPTSTFSHFYRSYIGELREVNKYVYLKYGASSIDCRRPKLGIKNMFRAARSWLNRRYRTNSY